MEQALWRTLNRSDRKVWGTIETNWKKWATDVLDILHPEFHHPHIPVKESTIKSIRIPELISLYNFLTNGIVESQRLFQRPECPVTNPKQVSLARYEYKKAMIEYISHFGHELKNPPCTYLPAFLEAFANYCEWRVREEKNKQEIRDKSCS